VTAPHLRAVELPRAGDLCRYGGPGSPAAEGASDRCLVTRVTGQWVHVKWEARGWGRGRLTRGEAARHLEVIRAAKVAGARK
jgi:hypothetical protein